MNFTRVSGWILKDTRVVWNGTLVAWMKNLKNPVKIIWLCSLTWIFMEMSEAKRWCASKGGKRHISLLNEFQEILSTWHRGIWTVVEKLEKCEWKGLYKDVMKLVGSYKNCQVYNIWMDCILHLHWQCIINGHLIMWQCLGGFGKWNI